MEKIINLTGNLYGPIDDQGDKVILLWKKEDDPERVMSKEEFQATFPYTVNPEEKKLEVSKSGISTWFN
jgi:hypothetical protein